MSTAPIQLHTTPPVWRMPSNSPACAKLETWLRMTGLEYQIVPLEFPKAPKGKIPFIIDGERAIGDSTLIIEHFGRTRGIDLERGLSPRERGISTALRRMIKENTYWAIYTTRYVITDNWASYRELVADILVPGAPAEVREQVAEQIKQGIDTAAHGHGWGRHSVEEATLLCRQDLDALSAVLGDNTWMMGHEHPTTVDATVFGYIGNLIAAPFVDDMSKHARSLSNLVALCERVRAKLFPELVAARND